jgi:hypothetical protein
MGTKMSKNEKDFVAGSKAGPSPSPRKLKQFTDRGGYALLECTLLTVFNRAFGVRLFGILGCDSCSDFSTAYASAC